MELMEELMLVSKDGFKSRHDDVLDCISMLMPMQEVAWKPSEESIKVTKGVDVFEDEEETYPMNRLQSYIV
jgi:hypothetical protein